MNQVALFLEKEVPLFSHQKFVLGVSGGVDSMVLLHQFISVFSKEVAKHMVVVHVNHHLREESDAEALLVSSFCEKYQVPFQHYHWNPETKMTAVEDRARQFRYDCYQKAMLEYSAGYLVLAHHGDDQVETILMKWTRGSTIEGAAGMKKKRNFNSGKLIRPFLGIEKKQLYEYARVEKVPYLEDVSNNDLTFTRNRYRHQIIPALKEENSQVVLHFQELSQLILDSMEVLEPIIAETFEQIMVTNSNGWYWDRKAWQNQSKAMQRLLLLTLAEKTNYAITTKNTTQIQQAIDLDTSQLELYLAGGWYFYRSYDSLRLTKTRQDKQKSSREYVMTVEEQQLQLSHRELLSQIPLSDATFVIELNPDDFPLTIRHRRQGDTIQINEKGQHQSIKRWCINEKIPQEKREKLWLVENRHKKIKAILGYRHTLSLSKRKETGTIVLFYKTEEVSTC